MSPEEKKAEPFAENVVAAPDLEEADDFLLLKEENRNAAERHIIRKLDMRLMPTVVVLYLMNYIDVSRSVSWFDDVQGSNLPSAPSVWLSLLPDFKV